MLSDRARRASHAVGVSAGLWVGLLIAMRSSEASAATLGNLATSVGWLSALATLLVIRTWPAHMSAMALPGVGAALLVVVAAAWLWRTRAPQRLLGFSGAPLAVRIGGARPAARARPAAPAAIVLPQGIYAGPLLAELRVQFVQLQAAWDLGEMQKLRSLTTPQMLDELCFEWPGGTSARGPNRTDVVTLHAELLGFEQLDGTQLVSVEFSGLIRETTEQGAVPFRELWMLAKSERDGSGWKLARQQALF